MVELFKDKKGYWLKSNKLYTVHTVMDCLTEKDLISLGRKIISKYKKYEMNGRLIKGKVVIKDGKFVIE